MSETILRTADAARYLNFSESTLEKLRVYGGGPTFIRLGARAVRYRRADLDAWLAAGARRSTSDLGEPKPRSSFSKEEAAPSLG
jgi:excisionase family DNA binding protein